MQRNITKALKQTNTHTYTYKQNKTHIHFNVKQAIHAREMERDPRRQ